MNDNYPGIFELTPVEQWFVEEIGKFAKRFKKRYLNFEWPITQVIILKRMRLLPDYSG